jgi:hypothetical protein
MTPSEHRLTESHRPFHLPREIGAIFLEGDRISSIRRTKEGTCARESFFCF